MAVTNRAVAVLVLAVAHAACSQLTDADLGACAEADPEWWPLRPAVWWRLEQYELTGGGRRTEKYTEVQFDRSEIHGLLGNETAVRTWRANFDFGEDHADEAGWRWVVAGADGFEWRADIWVHTTTRSVPCAGMGPDEDPRWCDEVEPISDRTYFPGKPRLDLRPEHLCERSVWRSTYVDRKIEIGVDAKDRAEIENCDLETWRRHPEECDYLDTEVTDEWTVRSVDETIDVPAGHFEHCLCVTRTNPDSAATYCFAPGRGKVFELDEGDLVECLADFQVDVDTRASSPDWEVSCDLDQLRP